MLKESTLITGAIPVPHSQERPRRLAGKRKKFFDRLDTVKHLTE